jgi:hypothetical protein
MTTTILAATRSASVEKAGSELVERPFEARREIRRQHVAHVLAQEAFRGHIQG